MATAYHISRLIALCCIQAVSLRVPGLSATNTRPDTDTDISALWTMELFWGEMQVIQGAVSF